MSRRLSDLDPVVEQMAWRLIAAAPLVLQRELFVVHTLRTYDEQQSLYEQGRTEPGKIVTNARGGSSFHNFGLAMDLPFEQDGTQHPTWSTAGDDINDWRLLGAMGEAIGFEWGGSPSFPLRDFGHFHYSAGQTMDRVKAAYERDKKGWKLNA